VPTIAISYRRADTDAIAGRIRDRLANRYGEDAVFMDIDNIPFGKDFRVHIREAVIQSNVLLVIIGQDWLGVDNDGNRRMDDETDFVRFEVETALSNAIPIIPVLVGSARMPQPALLPENLKNFAFLNAAPVDTGRDFHQHMERLIRGIDQIPDRRATSLATSGSRNEVASAAAPASASRDADADRADLEVFRDAPFAPELVVIPAGEFIMGSPEGDEWRLDTELPQHRVTIGQRFAIGRYPVTFDEHDRFCDARRREKPADRGWGRGRRPVINVSWQDAQAYIAWLSQETGRTYRLPSEAEWEYACRAGTATRYSFGDAITPKDANYSASGLNRTSEVGAYPANCWGLHDMHGNIGEWVEDDAHENYLGAPADGSAWKNAGAGPNRRLCVVRGGSFGLVPGGCRSAFRNRLDSDDPANDVGFRVARTLS
jgi:formylglycine-generating enzyme required for sulfatase activity